MAWMCMEGFDGLGSYSELPLRSWRSIGAGLTYSASGGRRGGGCIVDNTTGSTTERGIEFSHNYFDSVSAFFGTVATADFEIGMAIKIDGTFTDFTDGAIYPICSLYYSTAEVCNWALQYVAAHNDFRILQRYGTTVRILSTTYKITTSGQWYYLTFLVSGLGTTVSTRYNYILLDNLETGSSVGSAINASYSTVGPSLLKIGSANGVSANLPSGASISYDDIIFTAVNGDGEIPFPTVASTLAASTYIGQCRVDKVVPTKDSSHLSSEFNPSTGSDDYAVVDEVGAHDGDTTYTSSTTVGHVAASGDGMALPVTPLSVVGVRAFAVVKNTGDAAANVRCGLSYFGVEHYGDRTRTLAAGGAYEGLMSYGSDAEGASNALSTLWNSSSIAVAQALLEYVS